MTHDDLVPYGLTEAGKAYLEASGQLPLNKLRLPKCGWCKGPAGAADVHQGRTRFCDEDCRGLWARRQDLDNLTLDERTAGSSFSGTVDWQRARQLEFEEADELEGVEFITRLDEIAFERMMRVPYWVFIRPDGAVSLISADSREEAVAALQEVRQRTPEDLRPVPEHMLAEYLHDQELDLERHRTKLKV